MDFQDAVNADPSRWKAIHNRGLTFSIFAGVLILTFGLINSGFVRVVIFPERPSDFIQVRLQMENGTAPAQRDRVLTALEQSAILINSEYVAANPDSEPKDIDRLFDNLIHVAKQLDKEAVVC